MIRKNMKNKKKKNKKNSKITQTTRTKQQSTNYKIKRKKNKIQEIMSNIYYENDERLKLNEHLLFIQ